MKPVLVVVHIDSWSSKGFGKGTGTQRTWFSPHWTWLDFSAKAMSKMILSVKAILSFASSTFQGDHFSHPLSVSFFSTVSHRCLNSATLAAPSPLETKVQCVTAVNPSTLQSNTAGSSHCNSQRFQDSQVNQKTRARVVWLTPRRDLVWTFYNDRYKVKSKFTWKHWLLRLGYPLLNKCLSLLYP